MEKCNRINCPEYSSKCEGNCTSKRNVENCLDSTENFIFDLEWIPVTDEDKPEEEEEVLLMTRFGSKKSFIKGKFKNGKYNLSSPLKGYLIYWARITLPGVEQ